MRFNFQLMKEASMRRPGLAAWAMASVLFIVLHFANGITEFRFDARTYWNLSTWESLADFPESIRGYFYPLLLSPIRLLSDVFPASHLLFYRLCSALIYAYVFTVLLPAFWLRHFGSRDGFWRRLAVPVLICLLFPGVILYPLSDLPALSLMIGAVSCAVHASEDEGEVRGYAAAFLAGVLAYGAYNTRTIYLFPVIAVLVASVVAVFIGGLSRARVLALFALVVGMGVASVPQVLINQKNYDRPSPLVFATNHGKSLFTQQLLWGVGVQRYETAVDKSHGPRVFYTDPVGLQLLVDSDLDLAQSGIPDYVSLVARHPLEFAGIFCRHVMNGLDLRDGDAYTTVRSPDKHAVALVNFIVVFAGLGIIGLGIARSRAGKWGRSSVLAIILLLPTLAVIPGAIETRFFLAVHLAIYSALAFNLDTFDMLKFLRKNWLPAVLVFAATSYLFFSVTLQTMENMRYTYPDVYLNKHRAPD